MNILRSLPLSRVLLLCGLVLVIGVSATALALALDSGPVPPPKPLAQAIHDVLVGAGGEPVQGVSANITLTDHLLEGASLATGGHGGELTSSPLVTGGSGRLWIAKDGDVRLELQSQQGDTQILYDGHTLTLYDAATNTLYRYAPPAQEEQAAWAKADAEALHRVTRTHGGQLGVAQPEIQRETYADPHEVPSVAKIEEAIAHL